MGQDATTTISVPTTEEIGPGAQHHPHPRQGRRKVIENQRSSFWNAVYANGVLFLFVGLYTTCSFSFDGMSIMNEKRINLFESSSRLFPSFLLSSQPPKSDDPLAILQDAQALYDGTYVADPDYWKVTCFEDDTHNQVRTSCPYPLGNLGLPSPCNRTLLIKEEGGQQRVQRSEGVDPWKLTRWQPSSSRNGKETLKLFNHNSAVALLKEMGIKRINIIGDSMSRYFGFMLGGIMADIDLPQLAYGGDFNFIGEDCVGIEFYFYWRTTIPAMRELMDSYNHPASHHNKSTLVILNNNAHQINFNETSFWSPEGRFDEVKEVIAGAQAKWGERRVFWRTPNQMIPDFRAQVPDRTTEGDADKENVVFKGLTRGEMIDLDNQHTAARVAQECHIPVIDAFRLTDAAGPVEAFDGQHYTNWELYHEVNVWLNQMEQLYRRGWWDGEGEKESELASTNK